MHELSKVIRDQLRYIEGLEEEVASAAESLTDLQTTVDSLKAHSRDIFDETTGEDMYNSEALLKYIEEMEMNNSALEVRLKETELKRILLCRVEESYKDSLELSRVRAENARTNLVNQFRLPCGDVHLASNLTNRSPTH
jgi:FtsZ-binding cell division protein ZapB